MTMEVMAQTRYTNMHTDENNVYNNIYNNIDINRNDEKLIKTSFFSLLIFIVKSFIVIFI